MIVENLRRVFGNAVPEAEIERLAQAHYAHLWQLVGEFVLFRCTVGGAQGGDGARGESTRRSRGRSHATRASLVLTGHFGNWEVATVAGLGQFPQMHGRFHFVRRPIKPRWLDAFVNWRFRRAGFGVLLEARLARHHPRTARCRRCDRVSLRSARRTARRHRSRLLRASGVDVQEPSHSRARDRTRPCVPASSWREPDGKHVLRFEEPLTTIECDDVGEEIRRNTREYNAALERLILRHPEQWYWVHRRWKAVRRK